MTNSNLIPIDRYIKRNFPHFRFTLHYIMLSVYSLIVRPLFLAMFIFISISIIIFFFCNLKTKCGQLMRTVNCLFSSVQFSSVFVVVFFAVMCYIISDGDNLFLFLSISYVGVEFIFFSIYQKLKTNNTCII